MRNLGVMGESTFEGWCAEAGLTANRSSQDMYGWDFIVEFPSPKLDSPFDLHRSAIEIKVQVKATDGKRRKVDLGLSNAFRLSKAPTPVFVVIFEFDNKSSPQRTYLYHFDDAAVSRALKRVHQINESEGSNRLNKKNFYISYGDEQLLQGQGGEYFKDKVLQYLGDDIDKYIEKRKELLRSVGYEDGACKIRFNLNSENDIQSLIDSTLGLKRTISVTTLQGFHTRFGIESSSPFINHPSGNMEVSPMGPTTMGVMRFRKNLSDPWMPFDVEIYVSSLNEFLPENRRTIRIKGEFFDLIYNGFDRRFDFSFSVDGEATYKIHELYSCFKMLELMHAGDVEVFIELIPNGLSSIGFSVRSSKNEADFSRELGVLEAARVLSSEFGFHEPIDVSLNDLMSFEKPLLAISNCFSGEYRYINIQGKEEDVIAWVEALKECEKAVVISMSWVKLGKIPVGAILVFFVSYIRHSHNSISFEYKEVSIERKFILDETDKPPKNEIMEACDEVLLKYSDDFFVLDCTNRSE